MSNQDAIGKLLARTETVEVHGVTLELSIPEPSDLSAIREMQVRASKLDPEDDGDEAVTIGIDLTLLSVRACLKCTEGEAEQLVAMCGGYGGDLAEKVRDFLGMGGDGDESADPS